VLYACKEMFLMQARAGSTGGVAGASNRGAHHTTRLLCRLLHPLLSATQGGRRRLLSLYRLHNTHTFC
jgi:hypothetical protein